MSDFNLSTQDVDDVEDIIAVEETEAPEKTVLDSLRNELKRVVRNEPVKISVGSRPNMFIEFDTNIDAQQVQHWRKACSDKSYVDNFNGLKFSAIVIANQALRIFYNDEVVVDEDGKTLNFRNANFMKMLEANRASEAVRKLYGTDARVFIVANQIMAAAGYDSDVDPDADDADPTVLI